MVTKLIIFFLMAAILYVVEQGVKMGLAMYNPEYPHVLTFSRKVALLVALSYIGTIIFTGID